MCKTIYSRNNIWNKRDFLMCGYLQVLIPAMLQDLKENRQGSPSYLGENYTNEKGVVVNDECHKEWDELLERMIFLWRESVEDTCTRRNLYEEEYWKAHDEFEKIYGQFGEKLQTEEELERKRQYGMIRAHFMDEFPIYKDISDKYFAEEKAIEDYRMSCKDEAMDLLKEHFFALWD